MIRTRGSWVTKRERYRCAMPPPTIYLDFEGVDDGRPRHQDLRGSGGEGREPVGLRLTDVAADGVLGHGQGQVLFLADHLSRKKE